MNSPGTTTVHYWAVIPTTGATLHTTRAVVIAGATNDNPLPPAAEAPAAAEPATSTTTPVAANDNFPTEPLPATGTE